MAPDIPNQIQFEEMLSHTFPGFFLAVTLFMLVDVWSPVELTLWVNKDVTSLLSFVGFVLLFGTVLGVILDGIRHSIIEGFVFKKIIKYNRIDSCPEDLYSNNSYPKEYLKLDHYYFFEIMKDKARENFDYLVKTKYRYVEFHGNTFISLVPLSFVTPFYLFQVLQISWTLSFILAFMSLIIACICLYSSYEAFEDYQRAKCSLIHGYQDSSKVSPKDNNATGTSTGGKDAVTLSVGKGEVMVIGTSGDCILRIKCANIDSEGGK